MKKRNCYKQNYMLLENVNIKKIIKWIRVICNRFKDIHLNFTFERLLLY